MRKLLIREDGIALPTALMVLTLCLLMTAIVAEGADKLSASSGTDQRGKRAVAAADAGVDVAIRRLRALPDLPDAQCLTTTGVTPTGGVCPSTAPESLGNGASFTYVVSPATTSAANGCYQVPGTVVPSHYIRRCITATGRVGNEIRRVQEQVASPPRGAAQWMGILGLDSVQIINSAQLSACWSDEVPGPTVGSNISVTLDNSAVMNAGCPSKVWGIQMPPGRTPSIHWAAEPQGQIPVSTGGPFSILPPPRDFEAVENSNDNNAAYATAIASGVVIGNGSNYRNIRINNGGSLRLTQGGDFSVCSLYVDNAANLDFSTTQKTRIFVDSPNRPGSQCPAGSSGFTPVNGSRINWPSTVSDSNVTELTARAKNLEIYVYDNYLTINNTVRLAGLIQSERSTVHYVNGSLTWGAVAAKNVILENSGNFQRPVGLLSWGVDGPPYRSIGWTQCRSVAQPASTPHAGC
jgi:hypothetical protein